MTKDERRRHKIRQNSAYRYFKSPRYKMETIAEDRKDGTMRFTRRGELHADPSRLVQVEIDQTTLLMHSFSDGPPHVEFVDWRRFFPPYAQPSAQDLVLGVDFAFYDLEE